MIERLVLFCCLLIISAAAPPRALAAQQNNSAISKPAQSSKTNGHTVGQSDDEYAEEHSDAGLSVLDKRFIIEVSRLAAAETELARFAISKAASRHAMELAERLIEFFTSAKSELDTLAAEKGMTLEAGPLDFESVSNRYSTSAADFDERQKALVERLSRSAGAKFDRDYLGQMIKSYKNMIEIFRSAALEGQDSDVRIWAGKKIALLADYIEMAERARDKIKR